MVRPQRRVAAPFFLPRVARGLMAAAAAFAPLQAFGQATITQWTFEGDSITPSTGTGTATLLGTTATFAAGNGGGRAWNTSTYAAQSTDSGTRGVQFLFSTAGYGNLSFSFDHRASGTASRWSQLDYTLDGGTNWTTGFWNNNGGLSPHDTFYPFTVNLAGITGANNNPTFGVRIVSIFSPQAFDQNSTLSPFAANAAYMRANAGAVYSPNTSAATGDYGTSGTWRFDNVTLAGIAEGARDLTWNVAGGGTWDTTTANWTAGSGSTTFADNDNASFSDSAGGTVSLVGTLQPASTTIDAASGTYTFSGVSGGELSGAGSVSKANDGIAVFTSANAYTGGTSITGGVVRIDGGDRLGSGAIAVSGGTLQSDAASTVTLANAFSVGSAGATVDTGNQDIVMAGASSVGGVLSKTGTGKLSLEGGIASSAGAGFDVAAGTVQLGATSTSSGVYRVSASGDLTGHLIISGTQRFDVNNSAVLSGSGQLRLPTSGALISTTSGDVGGTISAEIALNSEGASFTPGSWSGSTYAPGTFVTTIGATRGVDPTILNSLTVSTISGASDVDFSNNSTTGGGGGQLVLNAVTSYTGNTTINSGTPNATGSSSIKLGVDNALPSATGVIVGTKTGIGAAVLDMNAKQLGVAYLADGANVTSSNHLTITNSAAGTSILIVGGSVTAGKGFSGRIDGGASSSLIKVEKNGPNSQTFSGANSYAGGTEINQGTLVAGHASAFGTGPITLNGGSLDLGGQAITNALTAAGGTVSGAANYAGSQTVIGDTVFQGDVGGLVSVLGGGVLRGNGTTFTGPVTIGSGGYHAPGASPGLQTFSSPLLYASNATLAWELWANSEDAAGAGSLFDQVVVEGASSSLAIASGAWLDLAFGSSAAGSTVAWSDPFWNSSRSWLVISASNAASSTGLFQLGTVGNDSTGATLASVRPGSSFRVVRSSGGDIRLNFTAVPEIDPAGMGSVLALLTGALGLLERRRSRTA